MAWERVPGRTDWAGSLYDFRHRLLLATVWTLYAAFLTRIERRLATRVCGVAGLAVTALAIGAYVIEGATYQPVGTAIPVANVRCLIGLLLVGMVAWTARQWAARTDESPHGPKVVAGLQITAALVAFFLVTVENQDFYLSRLHDVAQAQSLARQSMAAFYRGIGLPVGWMGIALGVAWLGQRQRAAVLTALGTGAAIVAALVITVNGYHVPAEAGFLPFFNGRMLAVVSIVLGTMAVRRWWSRTPVTGPWARYVPNGLLGVMTMAALSLATGEVSDLFGRQLAVLQATPGVAPTEVARLLELQSNSRSIVWLVFAAGLMGLGIWRRLQVLRYLAIGLFAVAILKVFLLDLASLSQLGRIISFIGLGVVLLLVSFLYQRFTHVISASDEAIGDVAAPDVY